MKNKQPNALREVGDSVEGEKIAFQCRKYNFTKLVHGSSSHRAIQGKLDKAICTITKKFRHIPEKKKG